MPLPFRSLRSIPTNLQNALDIAVTNAQNAASIAIASSGIYPDEVTGRAAVVDGKYFQVAGGGVQPPDFTVG
jgi:hypothetical protein